MWRTEAEGFPVRHPAGGTACVSSVRLAEGCLLLKVDAAAEDPLAVVEGANLACSEGALGLAKPQGATV